MSGLLTVTVKDTGKVEKFVNPQHVEDVYPEGTDVRVRLYPREYVAVVFERKLGDEDDVKYVDKGGRTKRLSNAQVCSSGSSSSSSSEGGVRPGTWVLSV